MEILGCFFFYSHKGPLQCLQHAWVPGCANLVPQCLAGIHSLLAIFWQCCLSDELQVRSLSSIYSFQREECISALLESFLERWSPPFGYFCLMNEAFYHSKLWAVLAFTQAVKYITVNCFSTSICNSGVPNALLSSYLLICWFLLTQSTLIHSTQTTHLHHLKLAWVLKSKLYWSVNTAVHRVKEVQTASRSARSKYWFIFLKKWMSHKESAYELVMYSLFYKRNQFQIFCLLWLFYVNS